MTRGKRLEEVITIEQSKCSLLQLVLFYFDCSHQYLYPLLMNCLCNDLFLALPTRSETNIKKLPIALP